METITNLLVLKDSSQQVACKTETDQYVIDEKNIANHVQQANRFLRENVDWGLVVVTSAARMLLQRDAWWDIHHTWSTGLEQESEAYQLTEEIVATTGLRHVFDAIKTGKVVIVNGHDDQLHKTSRHRNNDYLGADIIGQAACSGRFESIEYGMFTNVAGVLRDMSDSSSVIEVIDDVAAIRHLAVGTTSIGTTGSMATKFDAIEEALAHGASKAWITDGRAHDALARARAGEVGTSFVQTSGIIV